MIPRMAKAERLVLVDGSWLVYRAFFAIPANLATRGGLPTNAIFGFATMFRKLFAGRRPDLGAVVFDSPEPTFRELQFPAYKAQRPAMPSELAQQLPVIDRLVAVHRFPLLRRTNSPSASGAAAGATSLRKRPRRNSQPKPGWRWSSSPAVPSTD